MSSFKVFGEGGLCKKHSKMVYSVQFKLNVLNFMKQLGASYKDTAIKFKMNEPSLFANWKRTFLNEGTEGLEEKPKGLPKKPTLDFVLQPLNQAIEIQE